MSLKQNLKQKKEFSVDSNITDFYKSTKSEEKASSAVEYDFISKKVVHNMYR